MGHSFRLFLVAALALAPAALFAQDVPEVEAAPAVQLDLEQQALLRCAATIAILHSRQLASEQGAAALPDKHGPDKHGPDKHGAGTPGIDPHGDAREFFVRALAQIMDARQLSREDTTAMVMAQVDQLIGDAQLFEAGVPACLAMMEASAAATAAAPAADPQ